MSEPSPSLEETPDIPPSQEADADVRGFRADLPLAVLESVRHHDRPTELLEEEDLAASLPRRLGLTGVVESQIHRYTVARRRRERIPPDQVANLLRLVIRRPDAEEIFKEAGRDLARHHGRRPLYRLAPIGRLLPDSLCSRIARRSVRRLMRRIAGNTNLRVTRNPFRVELPGSITALADEGGEACILYSAAIREAGSHVFGRQPAVDHSACETRGDEACVWEVI